MWKDDKLPGSGTPGGAGLAVYFRASGSFDIAFELVALAAEVGDSPLGGAGTTGRLRGLIAARGPCPPCHNKTMKSVSLALLLAFAPFTALAHHSRLFIRTTTFDLGHPGQWYFLGNASLLKSGDGNAYEVEPGVFYAFGERADWGIEVHDHLDAPPGSGLGYEATGLEVRHRLTLNSGVNHAIGLEYEDNPFNGEPGEFQFQWIFGEENPGSAWMANLSAAMTNAAREQVHYGYSLAWGRTAGETTGYALELSGDVESHGAHELLPQVSFSLGDQKLLKVGVGLGLTKESPDYTVRVGFVSKMN